MGSKLLVVGSDLVFSLGQKEPTGSIHQNSSSPAITCLHLYVRYQK